MNTKKCIRCNADINIYASKCPYCKCSNVSVDEQIPSSLNLDFFSLSLFQSTIDEITAEYETKFGKPDRVLDTTYFAVEDNHFYHRFIFYGDTKRLVFISPDKQIILPYSQITGYDIIDNSFITGGAESAVTTTNTGSMLGRAAVGGLTLGVAGAVVGAMTAKTESTSSTANSDYIASYIVKIGVKSIEKPTLTLKFGSDKSKAEEVYALIQAIIAMK